MLKINVPGRGLYEIENVVFDYNGVLAFDGKIITGVRSKLKELAKMVNVTVLTADTFGKATAECKGLPANLHIIPTGSSGSEYKQNYVKNLGSATTAAFGNGYNDYLMLEEAWIGVVINGPEGCSALTLNNANVVVPDIITGIELFLNPQRLVATLRD